jgi:hypothetical protein
MEIEPATSTTPVMTSASTMMTTPAAELKLTGRVGPPATGKLRTVVNKREKHDLAKSMPPSHVLIPLLPLTDTEIVVYFFNALSRPVVALRLYGRHWGPSAICKVLNEHREVHPPYLRNTCSVKCTTSLRLGRDKFGTQWEKDYKSVFEIADDFKATDMIRNKDYEITVDYELRSLCLNLKKHPSEDASGMFTRCVKYCQETQATYKLSNAHELAAALIEGRIPNYTMPSSSSSSPRSIHSGSTRKRKRDVDDDGENDGDGDDEDDGNEDDDEYSTPTPVKNRGADDLAAAYRDT